MALSWINGYNNINYLNQMIKSVEDTLSNDYNDLDNIPIIKIISSTSNPQNIWELKEGMYLIDGIVYVDNNTSYEVSNLFVSMTARLENGKYVLSAFIPFFKGLYEYILKSNSTEYEEHQIVILATHERMLTRYNETPYEPNGDYNPATKKYVDDKANEIITELDNIGVNKETITSLKEENRIRDIKLQALLSETSDRNISISEDTRYFDMPLSIDNGIVTINEMIGDTLVNVCDQEESVAITKSYTIENENHIALQGEYDGSCRPIVHGNTLVNHNADWDGNLQTGVVTSASGIEDVQVEGIKGQEVSVVVEGNTVLNHAIGKTSAVVSDIKDSISLPKRDITLQGNSSVNDGVYTIVKNYSLFKPSTIYTFMYEVKNCTTTNILTLFASSLTVATTSVSLNTSVGKHTVTFTTKGILDSSITHGLYMHLTGSNATVDTSNQLVICNMLVLEGDHTTNPKYVNSNNGNYVDLTVANDMSSVVEIEGRTMVNVCDQKDPIAITKSYTVENSGNHIALQGEYDGSCRPVIQGNTMVNLLVGSVWGVPLKCNETLIVNSDDQTYPPGDTRYRLKYFKTNFNLKPNTTYTIVYTILTGKENNLKFLCDKEITLNTNSNLTVFTPSNAIDNVAIGLQVNTTNPVECQLTNIMLFEGDLTQTPELIPTEYVEGLKSSFEDNVVTQAMVDSGEESAENLGKYKVECKVTGKNKFNKDTYNVGKIVNNSNGGLINDNNNGNGCSDYIRVYSDKVYSWNKRGSGGYYEYDLNKKPIQSKSTLSANINNYSFGFDGYVRMNIGKNEYLNFQLEEGTVATEYEPYKEYTKTFYLNSPLLEGDTIEDVNGVATHVKRCGKVVLDGSEDENWHFLQIIDELYDYRFNVPTLASMDRTLSVFCDNLLGLPATKAIGDREEGVVVYPHNETYSEGILFTKTYQTVAELKQWLQANPTTIVYKLASPIYEPISDGSILCDSYVNGHLDFDSAVPVKKVDFRALGGVPLRYVQTNKTYIVQFEADNIGKTSIFINGEWNGKYTNVVKGINKIEIPITLEITQKVLWFSGIGFNASNIVVTEAIDADFDYFEGLKSSYEYEVTEDGKYKVDVKVTGENICPNGSQAVNVDLDTGAEYLGSPTCRMSDYIRFDSSVSYSYKVRVNKGTPTTTNLSARYYDINKNYLGGGLPASNVPSNAYYIRCRHLNSELTNSDVVDFMMTERYYENWVEYFESTKTFYLNSPLLEGDKLVTKNGKVYHYHKMGKVVLNGSESWILTPLPATGLENYAGFKSPIKNGKTTEVGTNYVIDTHGFSNLELNTINNNGNTTSEAITVHSDGNIYIRILKTKLSIIDVNGFKQWLSKNPTTVVYELASPYYELVDEYNNTILNIPKNVAHLTHTSAVPVNNTVFTNYKDELNVLEANTRYRVMFDCDKPCSSLNVTLGGTTVSCTSTTISGTKSFLITTPSTLVDKNLVIDGIGRCTIDNIRIFKGDVEYGYVKGLWSGYEERKLEKNLWSPLYVNLHLQGNFETNSNGIRCVDSDFVEVKTDGTQYVTPGILTNDVYILKPHTLYTIITEVKDSTYSPTSFLDINVQYNSESCLETACKCPLSNGVYSMLSKSNDLINRRFLVRTQFQPFNTGEGSCKFRMLILEGDWTDNPPTYEEVMANEGKYAVKVKLDTNATIFGKGGRL